MTRSGRMARLAAVLLALGAPAATAAQQNPAIPVYNVVSFRLTITGHGSDPNPSDVVRPPAVPALPRQDWSYSRVIEGWYEVDAVTDRAGVRARYMPRRGGRHAITGTRRDRASQTYQEGGEGADKVGYARYTAGERWDADVDLGPPDRSLMLELDSQKAVWTTAFLPVGWLGELESHVVYAGSAEFQPPKRGGFIPEWSYSTDRMNERRKGPAHIDTRYSPGNRGLMPIPPSLARAGCPAEYTSIDEASGGGTAVRGGIEFKVDKPRDVPGTFAMEGRLEWVVRVELPEIELKVRIPDYETWRPSAAPASAGEPLRVIAQVRHGDRKKKTPLPKIRKLTWRLLGTSREPGIAMNLPYGAAAASASADLSLAADGPGTVGLLDENQTLVVHDLPGHQCEARIEPWDWGGWGTLRVEAELVDGRVIKGELEGGPAIIGNQRDIPIPARIPGSQIALGWIRERRVTWNDDAEDLDSMPTGKPGTQGDGFTLYEEYRGFYWARGDHLSTDPHTKDLFIRIEPGAAEFGTNAVARFSGLAVHWTKRADFLPNAPANQRTVNINIGKGATRGPQTALYVIDAVSIQRINDSIPPGSRPATVAQIPLPVADAEPLDMPLDARPPDTRVMLLHQLTQAVLQACGVERPGPSDRLQRLRFVPASVPPRPQLGSPGYLPPHFRLGGNDVLIYLGDTDVAAWLADQMAQTGLAPVDLYYVVGEAGGAHSGPEECVMRDWFARLYRTREIRDGFPVYRFAPEQRHGNQLGKTRAGTGINASSRPGGSVFGDSAVTEPARQQLNVKDSAR